MSSSTARVQVGPCPRARCGPPTWRGPAGSWPAAHRRTSPHVVYPSIVCIDQIPFSYYRAKLAAERIVEGSRFPWTIVRATQFHDLILRVFSGLGRLPVVPVPRCYPFQPIEAGEVADRLVDLVETGPASRTAPLGGPQILSARALARAYLAAVNRPLRVIEVPLPGATSRAFRAGHNLCPDQRSGRKTWEAFLEATLSKGTEESPSSIKREPSRLQPSGPHTDPLRDGPR